MRRSSAPYAMSMTESRFLVFAWRLEWGHWSASSGWGPVPGSSPGDSVQGFLEAHPGDAFGLQGIHWGEMGSSASEQSVSVAHNRDGRVSDVDWLLE